MITDVGSYTLGGINVGLLVGIGLINPMLLQFDLFLTGQFGLGAALLDVQVQFNAALQAALQMRIGISDPLAVLRQLIAASAMLQASLSLALSFGLPTVSAQLSLQISAVAKLQALLGIKLGGLKLLVSAGLAVKIPVVKYVAQITAALNAGPAHLVVFRANTLAGAGAEVANLFAHGLGPSDPLLPGDLVDGVIIVTKDPAVFQALAAILRTS